MEVQDKKEMILVAAEAVFKKYTYNKSSMDDIAKEAGIGKGTIYYYFESKEDIFLAIIKYYQVKVNKKIEDEIDKHSSFENKFKAMIELPIKYAFENAPLLFEALSQSNTLLKKTESFKTSCRDNLKARLISMLEVAQLEGKIREDISVNQLVEIIIRWFLMGDDYVTIKITVQAFEKFVQDYKIFTEIILNGILKRSTNEI